MLLAHLASTQPQLETLPPPVLQLMQAPGLVDHLAALEGRGVRVGALLSLLLPAVLDGLAAAEEPSRQAALAVLLQKLVSGVPLESHAQAVTQRLLKLLSTKESLLQSEAAPALQQALRCATRPVLRRKALNRAGPRGGKRKCSERPSWGVMI